MSYFIFFIFFTLSGSIFSQTNENNVEAIAIRMVEQNGTSYVCGRQNSGNNSSAMLWKVVNYNLLLMEAINRFNPVKFEQEKFQTL